jgi:peptidoglycan hydrolase CwlO-like protein
MNLCDDDHEEICYESRNCPCCELKKEIKILEEEISEFNKRIKILDDELNESESQVDWYKNIITPEVIKKSPELLEPFLLKE